MGWQLPGLITMVCWFPYSFNGSQKAKTECGKLLMTGICKPLLNCNLLGPGNNAELLNSSLYLFVFGFKHNLQA
jgi:hypothetical protein